MGEPVSNILASFALAVQMAGGGNILDEGAGNHHMTTHRNLPNQEVEAEVTVNCKAVHDVFNTTGFFKTTKLSDEVGAVLGVVEARIADRHKQRVDALASEGIMTVDHPHAEMNKGALELAGENIRDTFNTTMDMKLSAEDGRALAYAGSESLGIDMAAAMDPEAQRKLATDAGKPYVRTANIGCGLM